MAYPKHHAPGLVRVIDGLFFQLRREGLVIAPAQAVSALQALSLIGLADRQRVRAALAACLVTRACDRDRYCRAFDSYFSSAPPGLREAAEGRMGTWGPEVYRVLSEVVRRHAARSSVVRAWWLGPEHALDFLSRYRQVRGVSTLAKRAPGRASYLGLEAAGQASAFAMVQEAEARLVELLGPTVGGVYKEALARELGDLIEWFRREIADALGPPPSDTGLLQKVEPLGPEDVRRLRLAMRELASVCIVRQRRKGRRRRTQRIHWGRTQRRAMTTAFVPLVLVRRRPRRPAPILVLACDVSESVRHVSALFLEFASLAHGAFERTRSFVFVSDLVEVTKLFRARSADAAVMEIASGRTVPQNRVTSYGRALGELERLTPSVANSKTTLIILGDGRTCYGPSGLDSLAALRARAGRVLWLCPEGPETWSLGDSLMLRYQEHCDEVLVVRTAEDILTAVRRLVYRPRAE